MPTLDKESKKTSIRKTDIGTVYVEKGFTKNLGEFNSSRVTIGMTVPINPTDEELREAKRTVRITSEIVEKLLEKELDALED